MVAASIDKGKLKKTMIALVVLALVIVAVVLIVTRSGGGAAEPGESVVPGETTEQREDYLASLGVQVAAKSSVAQVQVPAEFNEQFLAYNEMLKTTGFDLAPYKGATISKCVYSVTNRPDVPGAFSAVLLVYEGNVIGGHLYSDFDSSVHPLFEAETDPNLGGSADSVETILPEVTTITDPNGGQTGGETASDPATDPNQDPAADLTDPIDETMFPLD